MRLCTLRYCNVCPSLSVDGFSSHLNISHTRVVISWILCLYSSHSVPLVVCSCTINRLFITRVIDCSAPMYLLQHVSHVLSLLCHFKLLLISGQSRGNVGALWCPVGLYPIPAGLQHSPYPIVVFKEPTSKGRGGKGRARKESRVSHLFNPTLTTAFVTEIEYEVCHTFCEAVIVVNRTDVQESLGRFPVPTIVSIIHAAVSSLQRETTAILLNRLSISNFYDLFGPLCRFRRDVHNVQYLYM